jgi:hypothetical protein
MTSPRQGHVYGTVLVDIDTRRPLDMLPERSAEPFRGWLDARPGATAATPDQLIPGARLAPPRLLDPHQAYLRQRWDDGVRSTSRLHQELCARGYTGSLRTLRRLTARLRHDTAIPDPPPAPAAKKVAR